MKRCEWFSWGFGRLVHGCGHGYGYGHGLIGLWCGRKVFVSFGGLLLYMEGPYKNLTSLRIDYVYLCIKR